MGVEWPDVSRGNPRLQPQARRLRAYLRAALRQRGARARLSEGYAISMYGETKEGSEEPTCADRISKILAENGPHPEPATLWHLSDGGLRSKLPIRPALALYDQAGHLSALVHAVGTVDFSKIGGAGPLRKLLDWLGDIETDATARRAWALNRQQREAFLPPEQAAKSFEECLKSRDDDQDNLWLAQILATTYTLPYEYRRRMVIEHLMKWLSSVEKRPEVFTPKRPRASAR